MKKTTQWIIALGLMGAALLLIFSTQQEKTLRAQPRPTVNGGPIQRILYVDSYNEDYPWSAGITRGIESVLNPLDYIELEVFRMDTKNHPAESNKVASAQAALERIRQWKPDLVITSDDNAAKYLVEPYLKNSPLPVVFCGINWSAAEYGFPCSNVTGMVEVQLMNQILSTMRPYVNGDRVAFLNGDRIAFLKGDDLSSRKEADQMEQLFDLQPEQRLVSNYAEWEAAYVRLQDEVDMILLGDATSIADWDAERAERVVMLSTRIPSGSWDAWMADYSLVTIATSPREQGEWSARTALKILDGMPPGAIPLIENKRAQIYLNMRLAKLLDIRFPMTLLKNAHLLSAEKHKVLVVNSYHEGYPCSDDIEKGLLKALGITRSANGDYESRDRSISLKVFRMDTKRNQSDEFKQQAAQEARRLTEEWEPDCVVVSDDNAVKFLLAPYFKGSDIPFVFCGLNWDASEYGLPSANSTGMIEIAPYKETFDLLRPYAAGNRVGIIGMESLTCEKDIRYLKPILSLRDEHVHLVSDFNEWKQAYSALQETVDMIIWMNPIGIQGWDPAAAEDYVLKHTKIPTGCVVGHNTRYALLGKVQIAEEQGWRAGHAALQILHGAAPSTIPVATNKQSRLYINMKIANRLGIHLPVELLNKAQLVNDEEYE
ncbi:MAG: hypothetical protein ISR85_04165 [Kiritimatiellales bacterium]|nr:hypothetical protein [Kiritimatiellota bacterium]MBL7012104.1 hypothetical protein [Kiritimatiellales bacterium]